MGALSKALLLFAMNWLDAQLTILWLRLNVATEGNGSWRPCWTTAKVRFFQSNSSSALLSAYVLYRFAEIPMARRGMKMVLGVYLALMVVHVVTGFSASAGMRQPPYSPISLACPKPSSLPFPDLCKNARQFTLKTESVRPLRRLARNTKII